MQESQHLVAFSEATIIIINSLNAYALANLHDVSYILQRMSTNPEIENGAWYAVKIYECAVVFLCAHGAVKSRELPEPRHPFFHLYIQL